MESRLTISGIAALLADSTGRSKKTCEDFIREFFRLASEALLEGETLRIKGFGSFKISEVESRSSVDISTGEPMEIEAYKKVVFTPSKEMAEIINSPFEAFESIEIDDDMPEPEEEEPATPLLEAGSDEEELDDIITYEAYSEDEVPASRNDEETNREAVPEDVPDPQPPLKEEPESEIMEPEEMKENIEAPGQPEPETIYIQSPDRYGRGFFAGAMTSLVVCLIVFMLGCFFDWWPVNFGKAAAEPAGENVASKEMTEEPVDEPGDITIEAEEEEPIYDTVSTTRYLTTIARQHYGNFNFWPYIYIENQDILGHPDRITPGTRVVVPPLSKYGVDPNNKSDEEEAKRKGLEIYRKFM